MSCRNFDGLVAIILLQASLCVVISCGQVLRAEGFARKDLEFPWGTRRARVDILSESVRETVNKSSAFILYMYNTDVIASLNRGTPVYNGGSNESFRIEDDMSLTVLTLDHRRAGNYTCRYLSDNLTFFKETTHVSVRELPLRITECSSMDTSSGSSQSKPCNIQVPNKTQMVNITCAKAGTINRNFQLLLNVGDDPWSPADPQPIVNVLPNDDASINMTATFTIDPNEVSKSLHCLLVDEDGNVIEKTSAVLRTDISEERLGKPSTPKSKDLHIALSTVLVIGVVVVVLVIVIVIVVRKRQRRFLR